MSANSRTCRHSGRGAGDVREVPVQDGARRSPVDAAFEHHESALTDHVGGVLRRNGDSRRLCDSISYNRSNVARVWRRHSRVAA